MPDLLLLLVIILVLALLWRGPKNLPRIGEALGRGVREARRESADPAAPETPTPDDPRPKV
jgi:Sec-independent protein translocase protein TatA